MSEPNGTQETSMEAILASIRRIIAEDSPLAASRPASQNLPGQSQPAPTPPAPQAATPAATTPAATPPAKSVAPQPTILRPTVMPPPTSQPPAVLGMQVTGPVAIEPKPMPAPVILQAPPPPKAAPQPAPKPAPIPAAMPPASPAPAEDTPAPTSVWGVLGDKPASRGEELVLTQMVSEDGSIVALDRPKPNQPAKPVLVEPAAGAMQPLDVLLLTDALPTAEPETIAMPVAAPKPAVAPKPAAKSAPVASPATPSSPTPAFTRPAPEPVIPTSAVLDQLTQRRGQASSPTLEDLVRQSLEPKIQEWLNANLKDIVERLVQREIDNISRKT